MDSISWMVHLRRNMLKNASSSPHASSRPRPKSSNKSATKPHPKSAVTASVPETFAILNAEIEESRDGESAGVQDITELFARQLGAVQDVLANNHQISIRNFSKICIYNRLLNAENEVFRNKLQSFGLPCQRISRMVVRRVRKGRPVAVAVRANTTMTMWTGLANGSPNHVQSGGLHPRILLGSDRRRKSYRQCGRPNGDPSWNAAGLRRQNQLGRLHAEINHISWRRQCKLQVAVASVKLQDASCKLQAASC